MARRDALWPEKPFPRLKFQIALKALTAEKTPGQIGKLYQVHPDPVGLWKKALLERGREIFARETSLAWN